LVLYISDPNPIYLRESNQVGCNKVVFGGSGGFVAGDNLGMFEGTAVLEVRRDLYGLEAVAEKKAPTTWIRA